jgi:hypothetical protein
MGTTSALPFSLTSFLTALKMCPGNQLKMIQDVILLSNVDKN